MFCFSGNKWNDPGLWDERGFGSAGSSPAGSWTHSTTGDTGTWMGVNQAVYSGQGYSYVLPSNRTQAVEELKALQDGKWVDLGALVGVPRAIGGPRLPRGQSVDFGAMAYNSQVVGGVDPGQARADGAVARPALAIAVYGSQAASMAAPIS